MKSKEALSILFRYLLIVAIALPNLALFYWLFTPLTINLVKSLIVPLLGATFIGNSFIINEILIDIIPACIAGSAYYLLMALNLSTPMPIRKRINSLLFIIVSFLILNVIRIALFSFLAVNGYEYFDIAHKLTWYFGSTILVVILWFASTIIFKIDKIPVYSDIMRIKNAITN